VWPGRAALVVPLVAKHDVELRRTATERDGSVDRHGRDRRGIREGRAVRVDEPPDRDAGSLMARNVHGKAVERLWLFREHRAQTANARAGVRIFEDTTPRPRSASAAP
jgi:hypothetical protein